MRADLPDEDSGLKKGYVVALFVAIVVLWGATPFFVIGVVGRAEAGSFGDIFGAINALFSGLAFAGVICAILLQRIELQLQRKELSLTREELRRSAAAQEQSGEKLAEQAEVMRTTAHLSALSSVIQATSAQIEHLTATNHLQNRHVNERIEVLNVSREKLMEELAALMHGIRSSSEHPNNDR